MATTRENIPDAEPPSKAQKREVLKVKKLSEHATIPQRGSAGAAGYDLSRCGAEGFVRWASYVDLHHLPCVCRRPAARTTTSCRRGAKS